MNAVVERFNRTLKTNMWRRLTAENTRNWINMLDKLMTKYNSSYHKTIRMKPIDASLKENEQEVWNNVYNARSGSTIDKTQRSAPKSTLESAPEGVAQNNSSSKFKIGDSVRISRIKGLFEKGYLPNWSEALYTIHEVKSSKPVTYVLKDTNGEIISGSFTTKNYKKVSKRYLELRKYLKRRKLLGFRMAW